MIDPKRAGVSESEWQEAIVSCHELVVKAIVEETHDARSIVLDIPAALAETFRYKAGQFLSFKVPHEGHLLVRSYSLASSPDTETEHKVTVKRVDEGRISTLFNDALSVGDSVMVVPPAGLFVLKEETRPIVLFGGGSGITPLISIIKSALATTQRTLKLVYANRDRRSIIFADELARLVAANRDRLEVVHSLDDSDGFLTAERVREFVGSSMGSDYYLCGPAAFMDTVEQALGELAIDAVQIHIERFISPPDPSTRAADAGAGDVAEGNVPATISVTLDGTTTKIPYEANDMILGAARRAGLEPPFSCEEGYCSCCMAKIVSGEAKMESNDCLTQDLLDEGWILTCQARCVGGDVKIEYPD